MSLRISFTRWLLAVTTLLTLSGAHAGIVVNGTRFIYPAKQQEIGVRVSNDGDKPSLVQVWIDRGDPAMPASELSDALQVIDRHMLIA